MDSDLCPKCGAYWKCDCPGLFLTDGTRIAYRLVDEPKTPDWLKKWEQEQFRDNLVPRATIAPTE